MRQCTEEVLISPEMAELSCERVCRKRLEPLEAGGPFHFFVLETICIFTFTMEFLLRMLASPATIGLRTFLTTVPNLIDLVAIIPFYIDLIMFAVLQPGDEDEGGQCRERSRERR